MCEERKLGNDIRVIHNMIGMYCDRYGADHRDGVAPMQGRTLGFLYCNKDKVICQKDIEQEFLISRATASKMLQSMEKKELIIRKEQEEADELSSLLNRVRHNLEKNL